MLPLATHGKHGPWFNGWCTRITDLKAERTVTLILGSFQDSEPRWSEVYTAVLVDDAHGNHQMEQVFSDPAQAEMHNADELSQELTRRYHDSNSWTLPIGRFQTNGSSSTLDFSFPSGLHLAARLSDRVLWNPGRPFDGPEGWVQRLPSPMLPTHYFVETLASATEYELNGQQGQGFAHQARGVTESVADPKRCVAVAGGHSVLSPHCASLGGRLELSRNVPTSPSSHLQRIC
ncbi:unnamed protein product, partial [Symbiodinium pilosum]